MGAALCLWACDPSDVDSDESEEVAEASSAIAEGIEDTTGLLPAVGRVTLQNGSCSGTLIGPDRVLFAGHCVTAIAAECSRFTFDQDATPVLTMRFPPAGSADTNAAGALVVAIDGVQVHPSFTRTDLFDACCPAGSTPAGCTSCNTFTNNKMSDVAIAHLAQPVAGVTPMTVLRKIGTRNPGLGQYPVNLVGLIGRDLVVAGTSATTQNPQGGFRAYALSTITAVNFDAPYSDILTGAACNGSQTVLPSAGKAITMTESVAANGGCPVPGDSGGPTFFNMTALGGTTFPELLSTEVLVAGADSAGNGAAPTCPRSVWFRYTATWDFNYTMTPNQGAAYTVPSNNGTFIGQRMVDFDADGVLDADDNCPVAPNPNQANCNEDAELARNYPLRGDACDPIPCPALEPRDPTKVVLQETNNGWFSSKIYTAVKDRLDITPIASNFFGNGAGHGHKRPAESLGGITSKYRYCHPNAVANVICGPTSIDDIFVDIVEGAPDPSRPYHQARMIPNPGSGSGVSQESLVFASANPPYPRRWKYQDDATLWTQQGWVTNLAGACSTGTCLDGRFWTHATTTKGRFNDPVNATTTYELNSNTTGFRVNNAGQASAADNASGKHLANHYESLPPDKLHLVTSSKPYQLPHVFWWKVCDLIPGWDGARGESSPLVGLPDGKWGVMQHEGNALVVDDLLTSTLRAKLGAGLVWAGGAEASLRQGTGGFHALAFAANGTALADVAGLTSGGLVGAGTDLSFTVPTNTGPAARTGFTGVYSRFDDLAFVVGGYTNPNTLARNIWMRHVKGTLGWTQVPLGTFTLEKVLAAQYSFRDARLWVLDESPNARRLLRIEPFSGLVQVVASWSPTVSFSKQWLVLDIDGNVVLASSSTTSTGLARFFSYGLSSATKPTIDSFEVLAGELLHPPAFDPKGHTLILRTGPNDAYGTTRRAELEGDVATFADLESIL